MICLLDSFLKQQKTMNSHPTTLWLAHNNFNHFLGLFLFPIGSYNMLFAAPVLSRQLSIL